MRTSFLIAASVMMLLVSCVDTTDLEKQIDELKARLEALDSRCSELNEDIAVLDNLVSALKERDHVTMVQPLKASDGSLSGYTIVFVNHPTVTIRFPEDDQAQNPATAPVISVRQHTDGGYYWTCNGEFVLAEDGNMVPVGNDGMTPELKVEDSVWYVSYDGGLSWEKLWEANLTSGEGNLFESVDLTDPTKVVLTLRDNTVMTLPVAYEGLVSLALEQPGQTYSPGDVVVVNYTALKNVSVIVDDSDVEASEVMATDSRTGTIRIQTSSVTLSKQRAFLIFTFEDTSSSDWRLLSFGASGAAVISDIK